MQKLEEALVALACGIRHEDSCGIASKTDGLPQQNKHATCVVIQLREEGAHRHHNEEKEIHAISSDLSLGVLSHEMTTQAADMCKVLGHNQRLLRDLGGPPFGYVVICQQ